MTPVSAWSRCRVWFLLALLLPSPAARAAAPQAAGDGGILDVPYLTQTEQLCGGAALAMVLRYWGARDVLPEDFSRLVDRQAGGIRASRLTAAVVNRGWRAFAIGGDFTQLRAHIAKGRPLIAMVEERPSVYHYVVIVGVTTTQVIYHDPARAPRVTMSLTDFERRWAAADHWLLLALPPDTDRPPAAPPPAMPAVVSAPAAPSPCSALVDESINAAIAGRLDDAERGLVAATTQCAGDAEGWRELAGLRLVQRRYAEAAALAQRAMGLAPGDAYTAQLLGTACYAAGDTKGALDAWNRVGQPRIDVVQVAGLVHTHYPVVAGLLGLHARTVLTREHLTRAERRLAELPVAARTAVSIEPPGDGQASVTAIVAERQAFPRGLIDWAGVGNRAIFQRSVAVSVAGLAGLGEVLTPAYRFSPNRPGALLRLDVPGGGRLNGVLRLETMWDRQTYQYEPLGESPVRQDRVRLRGGLSQWVSSWLLAQAGVAADRIGGAKFTAMDGSLNARLFGDRVALIGSGAHWIGSAGAASFSTGEAVATWRSSVRDTGTLWTALAGVGAAGDHAPLATWPGASSGRARGVLLRAHRLIDDGIIEGQAFGRRLSFASVEYQRPVWSSDYGAISLAGFVDVARASRRVDPSNAMPTQTDIGGGVRMRAPGISGTLRVDVGYGLRDGRTEVSAGYVLPWGRRE